MTDYCDVTASSLSALTTQYRAVTQNLANLSTVGYKRQVGSFHQILGAQDSSVAGASELGATVTDRVGMDFSQGSIEETGRRLDVAIEGDGFFKVETPNGPLYTRRGVFATNAQGQLVDSAGRLVAGTSGPITISPDVASSDLAIASDGNVTAAGKTLGQIRVVRFEDTSVLSPVGLGCFQAPQNAAEQTAKSGECRLHQGYTESSNVSPVEELVKLINITRLYEAGIKTINAQDERSKQLLSVAMG